MSMIPRPQEIYKHFKGNLYQILTLAEDTETGETLVIYQALYGEFKVYARELSMFTGKVDRSKYPSVAQEYRFELVEPKKASAMTETEVTEQSTASAISQARPAAPGEQKAEPAPGARVTAPMPGAQMTEPAPGAQVTAPTVAASAEEEEVPDVDPVILKFLDAETYEEKLEVLASVHHRITQDMINTMAVACDVEVPEGDVENRYVELRNCLIMMEKFECKRLR